MATNAQMVNGLRKAADWLEAHPEFQQVYASMTLGDIPGDTPKQKAANLIRALGQAQKEYSTLRVEISHEFGGAFRLFDSFMRDEICERKVVGVKTIPATPEIIIPAQPERTEEIVEWECGSILADEETALAGEP